MPTARRWSNGLHDKNPAAPAPKRFTPRLEPVGLKISDIGCETFVWPVPRTRRHGGRMVFSGTYTPGAAGASDALQIRWRNNELCGRLLVLTVVAGSSAHSLGAFPGSYFRARWP